jgi:uncharacterized protein
VPATDQPSPFVAALLEPGAWPWPAERVELVETHISWVFLAGEYACKFKKPLDLGFLDFRDSDRRIHYCREELRLNGRLAPEIYLDLVGAHRGPRGWQVRPWRTGDEPGVRMRRFPDDARLDRLLAAGRLDGGLLEAFATELARFQQPLPPARPGEGHGDATAVARPALANFSLLPQESLDAGLQAQLAELHDWTRQRAAALAPLFDARLADGMVREGHGDLHLANLVLLGERIVAFDGIEFDPGLRWIDLQSEAAFLLMDLESRGESGLGWRFFNAWLAALGDYDGLAVLPWYLVYRHLVRAKIDSIRLTQPGLAGAEQAALRTRRAAHLERAARHARPPAPRLVLMHGLSGSGKSRLAGRLAPRLPAVWLRSDLERKRLHGLDPWAHAPAGVEAGLYDQASSARTYERLARIARIALGAGLNIIVDAAFLEAERREQFIRLALEQGARPFVLACEAPAWQLRERVGARRNDPSDAGLAVLEAQLSRPPEQAPLESAYRLAVDTRADPDVDVLGAFILDRARK